MKWVRRLPRWMPPLAVFLAAYFTIDVVAWVSVAVFRWWCASASVNSAILESYDRAIREQLHDMTMRAHAAVLLFSAAVYGLYRSSHNHPGKSAGYRKWLRATPWHPGLPLPLGPATAQWWDALVLVGALFLNGVCGTTPWMLVLLVACVAYSAGCLLTLLAVNQKAEAYVLGLGGSLILWAAPHIPAMLELVAVMSVIAHEGLRRSLRRFPWDNPPKESSYDPWPLPIYQDIKPRVSATRALLMVLMLSSWLGALMYQFRARPETASVLAAGICLLGTLIRWAIYCGTYKPPVTLLARILRGRLILPGYDKALVVPTIGLLMTVALPVTFYQDHWPAPAIASLSVAATLLVLFTGGPTLRVWQLTGYHWIMVRHSSKTPSPDA